MLMFGQLIEEIRLETLKRDVTDVMPYIMKKGAEAADRMKHSGNYSRSKLRKLGLLPNPYKKKNGGASR